MLANVYQSCSVIGSPGFKTSWSSKIGPPPDNLVRSPESTAVKREIDLTFSNDPASLGLSNLGWGSIVLGGSYTEVITGLRAQKITVKGAFVLRRVSDIPTLTE